MAGPSKAILSVDDTEKSPIQQPIEKKVCNALRCQYFLRMATYGLFPAEDRNECETKISKEH
jgi:hypothetical protein